MSKIKKYYLLGLICLMYFIAYLDRTVISVTGPSMQKYFGLSAATLGLVFSAFSYPYAILQIVGGTFGDMFGPRRVLTILMSWWSAFCLFTGMAWNFTSLFVFRLCFGLGEAGGFPVATRALSSIFGAESRGTLQGLTHAASRLGGAIAPPLVVLIMVMYSWKEPFILLGIIGLVWAALFWFSFKGEGIKDSSQLKSSRAKVPWKIIMHDKNIWALIFTDFCYGYSLWIYLTWLPSYLVKSRHFSDMQMGIYASLPLIAGVFGDLIGGWVSDLLYKKTGNLRIARRLPIAVAFPAASVLVLLGMFSKTGTTAAILLAGAMFFLELANANLWATSMDIGGDKYSGTISGCMNTGYGIAGIVSPIVFGVMVEVMNSWLAPFLVGVALLIIGTFTVFLIDPGKSLQVPDEISPAAANLPG